MANQVIFVPVNNVCQNWTFLVTGEFVLTLQKYLPLRSNQKTGISLPKPLSLVFWPLTESYFCQ